ncbi:HNH endonuclease-domain-containing protein [Tuber brumale]|nr:HNH endonuclease-domain-containing protein [Tuber brumale]
MSLNRFLARNVTFYDAAKPDEVLGGLVQNESITEANFLDIPEILLVVEGSPIRVQERGVEPHHIQIGSDGAVPLQVGVYDIYCDATIQVSNEDWVHRLISHKVSGREYHFRNDISHRDRKCVISGISMPQIFIESNNWTIFEAAHIFPLRHESLWIQYDYRRWITDMHDAIGSSKINSRQNGFLLLTDVHKMFHQYLISVNPDDGYKIIVFDSNLDSYDGGILDPVCRNPDDPHHVSDELLRWHFRQPAPANARGTAEPISEYDQSPETDNMGEIITGPYGGERGEFETAAALPVDS